MRCRRAEALWRPSSRTAPNSLRDKHQLLLPQQTRTRMVPCSPVWWSLRKLSIWPPIYSELCWIYTGRDVCVRNDRWACRHYGFVMQQTNMQRSSHTVEESGNCVCVCVCLYKCNFIICACSRACHFNKAARGQYMNQILHTIGLNARMLNAALKMHLSHCVHHHTNAYVKAYAMQTTAIALCPDQYSVPVNFIIPCTRIRHRFQYRLLTVPDRSRNTVH